MRVKRNNLESRYVTTHSAIDASVNWVRHVTPGRIETRFVQRTPGYFALYLSSQTGCQQACRMCHLTATGQTQSRDVTLAEYLEQADVVLEFAAAKADSALRDVHYNFMARGEPLANSVLVEGAGDLLDELWRRAHRRGFRSRFLVSTILPKSLDRPLVDIFDRYQPELYYSLYTMNEEVRRRWLPRALPANEALDRLTAWQRHSYKLIKIHYAFIEGVNDDPTDVHQICDAVLDRQLHVHINIVRYNPPSPEHSREPPERALREQVEIYRNRLPGARVQIVPRVGPDVYASCGMFVR